MLQLGRQDIGGFRCGWPLIPTQSAAQARWWLSTSSRGPARTSPTQLRAQRQHANTIRNLTPLTAPDAVVEEGLNLLGAAMQA